MGESSVNALAADNSMGDSGAMGVDALHVSVSFGRFENDLLSWEKWSTFPTNKYLDEVGKCSTPGSVAQKKAYFEAHYKKISARKSELGDQDRKIGFEARNSMVLKDQIQRDLVSEFSAVEQELDAEKFDYQSSVARIEQLENEVKISESEMSRAQEDEHLQDSFIVVDDSKDFLPVIEEDAKDESCCRPGTSDLHKSEEAPALELPHHHVDNARDEVSSCVKGNTSKMCYTKHAWLVRKRRAHQCLPANLFATNQGHQPTIT